MIEISRTETGKIFDNLNGTHTLEARPGPIHYKETYKGDEPWLDLDETYFEDMGDYLLYPKMPNIVKVYKNKCGYEIKNRKNPNYIVKVELDRVEGAKSDAWIKNADVEMSTKVHPYRVGIWKQFKTARDKDYSLRWKITVEGSPDGTYLPMIHKEVPDAYDDDPKVNDSAKPVIIKTTKTQIDAKSYYWDEVIPKEAKLVDTDFLVGTGTDDGYIWAGPTYVANGDYLRIGSSTLSYVIRAWSRFPDITIPAGATITGATITYRAYAAGTSTTVNTDIFMNDNANPTYPTSEADYDAKALTTAVTAWDNIGSWTINTAYTSPDFTAGVAEVIALAGWNSGQALMVMHKDGGSSGAARNRQAKCYELSTTVCPILSVTWTVPSSGSPTNLSFMTCNTKYW